MERARYDKYGRLKYDPEIHGRHGMPWTNADVKYIIENYEKDGPLSVSLVLERTIHTLMGKAYQLRRDGFMPRRTTTQKFVRDLRREESL